MDIELLRTYITVVDTGSLTRAALQVHRTQAALSQQMKRLEEQAGCPLFFKEGRQLELTREGKYLVSYARRLLALHDEALDDLSTRSQWPELRLGCPDDYVSGVLPGFIETLRHAHASLSFKIECASSEQLRAMLDSGELDAAILSRPPGSDEGFRLRTEPGVWVQHPNFAWREQDSIPVALYDADCKFHSAAMDGLSKQRRPFHALAISANANALMALVRQGLAISAVARSSMPDDLIIVDAAHRLPALPSVDIAVTGVPGSHPLITQTRLADWAHRYIGSTAPGRTDHNRFTASAASSDRSSPPSST